MAPDALIIQDVTLVHQVDLFAGLAPDGYVLVNTSRSFDELGLGEFARQFHRDRLMTCPATELALEQLGRPASQRRAARRLRGPDRCRSPLDAIEPAIRERFSGHGRRAQRAAAATAAYRFVTTAEEELAPCCARLKGPVPSPRRSHCAARRSCAPTPSRPRRTSSRPSARMVKAGTLSPCEFINVESEFAAMSVSIGASAAGARAYTATASQGLLFMIEAVYNAAGLGLPIVMTLANRAIGAPINIWNDHSDAMAVRDSGWIQLFAETNQEAADLHVQAFRLAEELSVPVMVCMDGFILTHAVEGVDVPEQAEVDAFLPPYEPRQVLDPDDPVSIGAMVGPEAFEEVRYLAHLRQLDAFERIPALAAEFAEALRPSSGGSGPHVPDRRRRDHRRRARIGARDHQGRRRRPRDAGERVGVVGITSFRPFPLEAVREALAGARSVIVVEKAFSIGFGGVLSTDVAMATHDSACSLRTVVAGLGGRPITRGRSKGCSLAASGIGSSRSPSSISTTGSSSASGPHERQPAVGPLGGERPPRPRDRRVPDRLRRGHDRPARPLLPGGKLRRRQPAPRRRDRTVQSDPGRTNSLDSGHRACQGCGEALGARYALDAAMRATERPARRRERHRVPRGVLDALPGDLMADRLAPLAVRQRAGGGHRGGRGDEGEGPERRPSRGARPGTAAPSTSASGACRGCSSATTTCCSSATTTRPT